MQASSLVNEQEGARKCSVCVSNDEQNDQTFSTADSLWAHIGTMHLRWIPFECILCRMVFLPTEGVLKEHYEKTHPRKEPRAVYTYAEDKISDIRQIFLESQKLLENNEHENSNTKGNSETATFTTVLCTETSEEDQMDISDERVQKPTISSCSIPQKKKKRDENDDGGTSFLHCLEIKGIWMERDKDKQQQTTRCRDKQGNWDQASNDGIVHNPPTTLEYIPNNSENQRQIVQPYQEFESNHTDDSSFEEGQHETSQGEENDCSINTKPRATSNTFKQPIGLPLPSPKARRKSLKKEKYIWCSVCKSQTTTAARLHIWCHHMDGAKRYSCIKCDYGTVRPVQMKAHVRHKHKELTGIVWVDHTAELKPHYLRQCAAAFGEHSLQSMDDTYRPLSPIQQQDVPDCNLCSRAVSRIHRGVHIWRFHMSRKRYVCVHCACGSPLLADMAKHVRLKHGIEGDGTSWTDNSRLLYDEYEQQYTAAYGSYIAKNYSGVAV